MLYWCAAVIQEGINHWEKRRERVPRVQCKTQKHKPGLQVLYSVIMFSSLTHAVVSRVFFIVQAKASRNPRQANGKCFCFYARNNTKYPFFQKSTCFVGICVSEMWVNLCRLGNAWMPMPRLSRVPYWSLVIMVLPKKRKSFNEDGRPNTKLQPQLSKRYQVGLSSLGDCRGNAGPTSAAFHLSKPILICQVFMDKMGSGLKYLR